MIGHSTDFERFHFILPGDASEKRPKAPPQLRSDYGAAFLGAEYTMEIGTRVRHSEIQPSLRDLRNIKRGPGVGNAGLLSRLPSGDAEEAIVNGSELQ